MKFIFTGVLTGAVAVLCAGATGAYEPDQGGFRGPYVAIQGGGVYADRDEIPGIFETDTGLAVLGSAGYGFGSGLRLEGEAGWRRVEAGPLIVVEDNVYSFFANVLYELPHGWLRPYIGAGAGVTRVDTIATDGFFTVDDEASSFAYQFIGGMSLKITGNIDIITDYRYTAADGLEFFGLDSKVDTHNITGGVRLHF